MPTRVTSDSRPQPPINLNNIRKFISARLYQFNLTGRYDVDDILNEAYLRWLQKSVISETMAEREAWFRTTAFNIIRELSREIGKVSLCEPYTLENMHAMEADSADSIANEHLRLALSSLPRRERTLLEMRFFRGMSWKEIADYQTACGQAVTESTLRKQGERAVKALRKIVLDKVQA